MFSVPCRKTSKVFELQPSSTPLPSNFIQTKGLNITELFHWNRGLCVLQVHRQQCCERIPEITGR